MNLEEGFRMAMEHEQYRQKFLDDVSRERGLPKYVKKLIYGGSGNILMESYPSLFAKFSIKGSSSNIGVYDASFVFNFGHYKLDDFLSTLEDHEYIHCKEFNECPPKINPFLYIKSEFVCNLLGDSYGRAIIAAQEMELRAFENQIQNFSKRNCSEEYMKFVSNKVMRTKSFLILKNNSRLVKRLHNSPLRKL